MRSRISLADFQQHRSFEIEAQASHMTSETGAESRHGSMPMQAWEQTDRPQRIEYNKVGLVQSVRHKLARRRE